MYDGDDDNGFQDYSDDDNNVDDNVDDNENDDRDDSRDEVRSAERTGTSVSESTGFDSGSVRASRDADDRSSLQTPTPVSGEVQPRQSSSADGWDADQELADAFGGSSSPTPTNVTSEGVGANQQITGASDGSVSAVPTNVATHQRNDSIATAEELALIGMALDAESTPPLMVSPNASSGYAQGAQSPPQSWFGRIGNRIGNILHLVQGADHRDPSLALGTSSAPKNSANISFKNAFNQTFNEIIEHEIDEMHRIDELDPAGKNVRPFPKDLVNEINRARVEFLLKVNNDETVSLQNISETFDKVYTPGLIEAYRERRLQEFDAEKDRVAQSQYLVDFFEKFDVQLPPPAELPERRSARIAILENIIDPPQKQALDSIKEDYFRKLREEAAELNSFKADLARANTRINDLERATVLLIKHDYKGVDTEFIEELLCPELFGLEIQELVSSSPNPTEPQMHISSPDHPRIDAKSVLTDLKAQVSDEFTAISINLDKHPPDLAKRLSQERADALLENGRVGSEETIEQFRERAASFERDNVPKIIAGYRKSLDDEKVKIGHMLAVEKIFDEHAIPIDLPKELVVPDDPAATLGVVVDAIFAASAASKRRTDWSEIEGACREAIEQPKDLVTGRQPDESARTATISV